MMMGNLKLQLEFIAQVLLPLQSSYTLFMPGLIWLIPGKDTR